MTGKLDTLQIIVTIWFADESRDYLTDDLIIDSSDEVEQTFRRHVRDAIVNLYIHGSGGYAKDRMQKITIEWFTEDFYDEENEQMIYSTVPYDSDVVEVVQDIPLTRWKALECIYVNGRSAKEYLDDDPLEYCSIMKDIHTYFKYAR